MLPILVGVLHLHDLTIVILASLSLAARALTFFFAKDKRTIYVAIAFCLLNPLTTQPLRSLLTQLVGPGGPGAMAAT